METETLGTEPPAQPGGLSGTSRVIAAAVRSQVAWRSWNQRDIARETGLKPAYISLRWNAERAWTLDDVERIAHALNLDVWKFFNYARDLSQMSTAIRPGDSADDELDDQPEISTDIPRRNTI